MSVDTKQTTVKFHKRQNDIMKQLHNAKSPAELGPIRQQINELKNWLSDKIINGSIPKYDVKNYSNSLNSLILKFDDEKKNYQVKKFKFSRKLQKIPLDLESTNSNEISSTLRDSIKPTFQDLTNVTVTLSKQTNSAVYMKNISNSTITVPEELDIESLTLESCINTIFRVFTKSFLFVNTLSNCMIEGKSQQLRIHNSFSLLLNLRISNSLNRLIIEGCRNMFIVNDSNLKVDDFSFLNVDAKNPNYMFLASQKRQGKYDELCSKIISVDDFELTEEDVIGVYNMHVDR